MYSWLIFKRAYAKLPFFFFSYVSQSRSVGVGTGVSTGYKEVDEIYTIVEGQLSVVTGHPSSGKSEFIDQIMVNIAKEKKWKL